MSIQNIIFKIGDGFEHLVSATFAVSALGEASKGNYDAAALEAVIAGYIQIQKYIDKKYNPMPKLMEISKNLEEAQKKMDLIDKKLYQL